MTLASHSSIEQNAKEPWMVRLNEFVQVKRKKEKEVQETKETINLFFNNLEQYTPFYELY